jgi:hypothetical protein
MNHRHLARSLRVSAVVLGAATLLVVPAVATAASRINVDQCLELTNKSELPLSKITKDLGLSRDLAREVQARLSQYWSSNYAGIDDLGLTPEQSSAIKQRIAAEVAKMNAHPVGWPCAPFKHRTAVMRYMRRQLIANGFHAAGLKFTLTSPRQIQYQGIKDGEEMWGAIVTSALRTLTFTVGTYGTGRTYTWKVGFTP